MNVIEVDAVHRGGAFGSTGTASLAAEGASIELQQSLFLCRFLAGRLKRQSDPMSDTISHAAKPVVTTDMKYMAP
jgi:hypothetical protein